MIKTILTLFFLLFTFSSYSITTLDSIIVMNIENDFLDIVKKDMLNEHFKSNVVLMPNGIYDGYLPYVHELIPDGRHSVPEGYMFFINLYEWSCYIEKKEPSFHSNIKKFGSISDSSKELYTNKYETQLAELQIRDMERGVYSFERAVVVSYLRALGYSVYVSEMPYHNHYMRGIHSAGIDESPTFKIKLGDDIDFNVQLKDWEYFLKEYNLLEDVHEARLLYARDNIDSIVDYNEDLNKEKQKLEHYEELIEWREGVDSGKYFLNIEEYEAYLEDMQQKFPGKFENDTRLQNQMKIELDRLEYQKNFENEYNMAKKHNVFPQDITFKKFKIQLLQYFVSGGDFIDYMWYLNWPDYSNPKEIAYTTKPAGYRTEAVYLGERPKEVK